MDSTNQLINKTLKNLSSGRSDQSGATGHTTRVTDHEREITDYVFAALRVIYPRDYNFDIDQSPEVVKVHKRSLAPALGKYNREQVDKGLAFIREQKRNGEARYMRLDLDVAIGAIRDANRRIAAHQQYEALPPPQLSKAERAEMMQKLREETKL